MKKYIYSALALSTIILGACNDDDLNGGKGKNEGDFIEFTLSGARSRTIYEDQDTINGVGDNEWQINWEENDPIRIYSAEAKSVTQSSNADASYTITDIKSDGNNHDGYLTRVGENGLQWGTAPTHDFFAVFPDDGDKIAGYDHTNKVVTFNFNANQSIKFLKKDTDGNYTAVPDMTKAYMVAVNTGVTNGESVPLEFDPIMTTLEINVKGQGNTTGTVITGVSIVTTFNAGESVISSTGTFQYDIDGKDGNGEGEILPIENSPASTQTIFIEIPGGVSLTGTQTLNVTAFVPPATLTSGNTKIQVHATTEAGTSGTVGVSRKSLPIEISPSHKKILNLPNLPTPITNNWITPLDDNIYVSQLSIPGTHDAATGNGFDSSFANIISIVGVQFGQTQSLTLDKQWEMGIRCFDLRPAQYTTGLINRTYSIQNYHGIIRTNSSFTETLNMIANNLKTDASKREFAIILMRHESEIGDLPSVLSLFAQDQSKWQSLMNDAFNDVKETYGDTIFVNFKPDLTVKECRGKILVLSRDSYTNGPVGGYISGWGHSASFEDQKGATITGTSETGTLYVQDFYDVTAAGAPETKLSSIKTMLNFSKTLHTDNNHKNTWVINHLSGYNETATFLGIDLGVSTTEGYRSNAAYNHDDFYNLITASDWNGSTGIILMDYVGSRTSGTHTVYGDLLPQAIIDNNYKYVMKRASN